MTPKFARRYLNRNRIKILEKRKGDLTEEWTDRKVKECFKVLEKDLDNKQTRACLRKLFEGEKNGRGYYSAEYPRFNPGG